MYDDLVQELRYLAKVYSICQNESTQEYKLAVEAADAIEELQAAVDGLQKTIIQYVIKVASMHGKQEDGE